MKQTLGLLVIALLGVLCERPAQAVFLHEECPSDLGYASTCSPSIDFTVFDNSISTVLSPLSVTPVSVYNNDYLIAITNSSSTPIYGVILSTSPYVTADTGAIGSPCAGSSDGYSATAQICDPLGEVTFPGGLLPGQTQGFALEFLPGGPNCGTSGHPPCISDPAVIQSAIYATQIVQVDRTLIPEPAPMGLMGSGFGMLGLALYRLRRRRN